MKYILLFISIRILILNTGCIAYRQTDNLMPAPIVYNYITPCDAQIESATNTGHQEGFSEGRSLGYAEGQTIGYQQGYKIGKAEGFHTGHAFGADSVLGILEKLKDPKFDATVVLYYKDHLGDIAIMKQNIAKDAFVRGKDVGEREAYALGYKHGYNRAFDSVFDARIQQGRMVAFPTTETRLSVNYKKVATLLHKISGKERLVEAAAFSQALWEIHTEILRGLTIVLKTDPFESREVMECYQRMHQSLSDQYYQQYRNRCKSEIRDYSKKFYDYRYYHSVDAFFDIVESGVCIIADVAFTFAKNSHSYSTSRGFKVMGNICEIIIGRVMIPVRDYTLKYGIMQDYDLNLPAMNSAVRSMLDSAIADIRTHKKTVKGQLTLANGSTATVTMEIETKLAIGFKAETFRYETIHNAQELRAFVSDDPRIIKVLKQDFKVQHVDYTFSCLAPPCNLGATLNEADFLAIFEKNKDNPQSLPESKSKIQTNIDKLLIPVVVKVAEPALALPHSCYNLVLHFGENLPRELVSIECENAPPGN